MRSVEAAGTESCRRRQSCIRELLQEVNVHGKADRHMRLLTIEKESRLGTLWDQEDCNQLCSKEELLEAARDEEMKIPWRAANEAIRKKLVRRLLEEQDKVLRSYFAQKGGTPSKGEDRSNCKGRKHVQCHMYA